MAEKCFCHIRDKKTGECYTVKDATARKSIDDLQKQLPTKISELENDGDGTSQFTTKDYVDSLVGNINTELENVLGV